uniref:Uncharacterized protein n=1 Tax=viral metagenome TaxID=1070528 RepID=A0A6M3J0M9_9ZZZZ
MKKQRQYKIGDTVLVNRAMWRGIQGRSVKWMKGFPFPKLRLAQITGLCKRYDGHIKGDYDDVCVTYFVPSKTHTFWLVRFGLMNKEVPVSEEDITPATVHTAENLPTIYPRPSMSERDKQLLREDSVNWPRDEKGRWVAGPCVHEY